MDDQPTLIQGGNFVDARGILNFVNDFNFSGVKRFYQATNHELNFVRAWQGHAKEGKYIYVATGSALVAAVKLHEDLLDPKLRDFAMAQPPTNQPMRFTLSAKTPSVLWIPPGYANGWTNLENGTNVFFFSTATLEESKADDLRFPPDRWSLL
jgi:dTDP-4-dehydrorhamnose 3,5-epimerase